MDGRGRALDNVFVERLWQNCQVRGGVSTRDQHGVGGSARVRTLPLAFTMMNVAIRCESIAYPPPYPVAWGNAVHKMAWKEVRRTR